MTIASPVSRKIWVRFQREGIHCYPAALTDPSLESVKFLGHDHRHVFHFQVAIQVSHNDRDVEFIIFKRWLESLYGDGVIQLDHMSCEMIASSLYEKINQRYPGRAVEITVSEDGENGATLVWEAN
jgi:hypothetical protein